MDIKYLCAEKNITTKKMNIFILFDNKTLPAINPFLLFF